MTVKELEEWQWMWDYIARLVSNYGRKIPPASTDCESVIVPSEQC